MTSLPASYRVDRNALRTDQAFTIGLTLLAFVLGDAVGRWIALALGLGHGAWSA